MGPSWRRETDVECFHFDTVNVEFGLPELVTTYQLDVESKAEDGKAVLTRGSMIKTFRTQEVL